jgi:hypothetical protein
MNDKNIPLHYFERFNKNDILQRIDCETRDDEPIHCLKIKCMMKETFHERYHCLNEIYPDGIPGDVVTNQGEEGEETSDLSSSDMFAVNDMMYDYIP